MLKKIFFTIVFCFSFFCLTTVGATSIEKIQNYDITMEVLETGDLNVQERIEYDFGGLEKHGIYRDIPIRFDDGGKRRQLQLENIEVTDEKGIKYPFEIIRTSGNMRVKVGDPSTLLTGIHTYIIDYFVSRPVAFFKNFDRVSWNAIGTYWNIPIEKSSVKIILPALLKSYLQEIQCYRGYIGQKESCKKLDGGANMVFDIGALAPGQGVTVDINLQKGVFVPLAQRELFLAWLREWWPLLFPIFLFITLLHKWYKEGRDPKGRGTIVTQFDPPDGLSAAQVGVVYDTKAQNKDVWAQIISLAIAGFLKIEQADKKEFTLVRKKGIEALSQKSDQDLYRGLFQYRPKINSINDFVSAIRGKAFDTKLETKDFVDSVALKDLKNVFVPALNEVKKSLYEETTQKGYFVSNPEKKRRWYQGGAVFGFFFGFWLFAATGGLEGTTSGVWGIAVGVCGLICLVFSFLIPARTFKGKEAQEHIDGLKKYITIAEKDRIDFHNAPEKNPEEFERLLPYAMVLGVETKWAKQFSSLEMSQPSWYSGPTGSHFGSVAFAQSLGDFSSQAGNNLGTSASGSGGSVGGGGGGGGGGSW